MSELTPFNTLPVSRYFQHDLEKIKMAFRLADSIRGDLKNIKSSGNEVEQAVHEFFSRKLFPKYHVAQGHIVDEHLKVSPQYDVIICENAKNPVLFTLSDGSQLVYFETVYCFCEVKKSFYHKDLINDFCINIQRTKAELKRAPIDPRFIETASGGFLIEDPLTSLPVRNPLLCFAFFVDGSAIDFSALRNTMLSHGNAGVPNFIVLLNLGIVLNVNKSDYEAGRIKINLYPEFETEENIWIFLPLEDDNSVLMYQYLLVTEHLNNTITQVPNVRKYTRRYFNINPSQTHPL